MEPNTQGVLPPSPPCDILDTLPPQSRNTGTVKTRMTLLHTYYHQRPGVDPTMTTGSVEFYCDEPEQVYTREKVSKDVWEKVDMGWVERPGMMFIKNIEKSNLPMNPTFEQLRTHQDKTLELCFMIHHAEYNTPQMTLSPGKSMHLFPDNSGATLYVRGKKAGVSYKVEVYAA